MQRRSFIRNTALTAAAMTILNNESFARFFADPAWKIKMLNDKIGVFTEKGGTIAFLLSKKGIVVIDAQFADTAPHLIEELKKKNMKFSLLINTHHHSDHTAGNISFKGLVKKVVAHENSYKNQKEVAVKSKTEDKQLYPGRTFGEDGWYRNMGDEVIQTYYFGGGHTNGDAIIHFEHSNIAHMGDLVFNRRYPFIDRSAGASVKSWIKVLHKTDQVFDTQTQFIFGHSGAGYDITGNINDVRAFKDYLEKLWAFGEKEIKAGTSRAEFIKNTSIPGVTEWKGDGIDRSLSAVYDEIVEKG
jgi:glyoxylase-like metal-dependent hydrolase (beta-lactamase superfamily II)